MNIEEALEEYKENNEIDYDDELDLDTSDVIHEGRKCLRWMLNKAREAGEEPEGVTLVSSIADWATPDCPSDLFRIAAHEPWLGDENPNGDPTAGALDCIEVQLRRLLEQELHGHLKTLNTATTEA